jgi:large subunit ribosomal protein L21
VRLQSVQGKITVILAICREKTMYAIIKAGGKQYRVAKGDVIDIDLLKEEIGSEITFGEVLFFTNDSETLVGEPTVPDYFVVGEHIDYVAGPKISCVKYIPGNHRKKIGHRQHYSRVKITKIESSKKR